MSYPTIVDRLVGGAPPESFTAAERAELRRLYMEDPSYLDPKQPDHQDVVDIVAMLYEADHPPEADE
jgi:hypothetical protein